MKNGSLVVIYAIGALTLLLASACYEGVMPDGSLSFFSACYAGLAGEITLSIAYIFAGIAALYGLYVRTQQLEDARKEHRDRMSDQEKTQSFAKDRQITENIGRAIEQLGNEGIVIRCAGIRLLQRISEDVEPKSETFYFIREMIKDFVINKASREKASGEEKDENQPDLGIALKVVGDMVEDELIGVMEFVGLSFWRINVHFLNFCKYDLSETRWQYSNMPAARFCDTMLRAAQFEFVFLDTALFNRAHLIDAYLCDLDMHNASLVETNLRGACFRNVSLTDANFTDAIFYGTDCSGCDFSEIQEMNGKPTLTQDQVDGMIYEDDKPPILPGNLKLPQSGAYIFDPDDTHKIRRIRKIDGAPAGFSVRPVRDV